jgi:dienelactone hydrolase
MRYLAVFLMVLFWGVPSPASEGRSIIYQINNQPYEGYYIPSSSPASSPLVFLIHDWDGLTEYEKKRAQMLSEMGYSVFAMDLFGKGVRPTQIKDKRQHTGELYKNRQKMRALMDGAFEKAHSLGANTSNSVVAGYCFGGAAVLEWARSGKKVKGFVSFHGGLKTPEDQNYKHTTGHVLVLHGSADTVVTMAEFADLATELEVAGVSHEMITYGMAQHAFTVFGSARYNQTADGKSWTRFLSFLNAALEK